MPRRPAKSSGAQAEQSAADGGEFCIDVNSVLAAVVARLNPFVYCVRSPLVLYKFVLKQLFSHNYVRVC